MNKILTRFVFMFAVTIGISLFYIKYQVVALENHLHAIQKQIVKKNEALHVMKAEWVHLTEPKRLQKLAEKYLKLAPLKPKQIIHFEDLPRRQMTSEKEV